MGTPRGIPDEFRNLAGLKVLGGIRPLFAHLHGHACGRDKAKDRTLHLDQLASIVTCPCSTGRTQPAGPLAAELPGLLEPLAGELTGDFERRRAAGPF
jgi:hypothetical protein